MMIDHQSEQLPYEILGNGVFGPGIGHDAVDDDRPLVHLVHSAQFQAAASTFRDGVVLTACMRPPDHLAGPSRKECGGRVSLLAALTSDLIMILDPSMVVGEVSPAVEGILGRRADEIIGTPLVDHVHPEDAANYTQFLDGLAAHGAASGTTCQRYRHADGGWIDLETSFTPIRDPGTGLAGGYVAGARGTGVQKATSETFWDSKGYFRALAEALAQNVIISEITTGDALYVNARFYEYHGPVQPSLQGRLGLVHPDEVEGVLRIWVQARALGTRQEVEARLLRHDGAYRWHRLVTVPMTHGGRVLAMLSMALDIHDIIEAHDEIERTSVLLCLSRTATAVATWDWDPASNRLSLSDNSARWHGFLDLEIASGSMVDVSMADWQARIHPEDRNAVWAAIERTLAGGQTEVAEFRVYAPEIYGGYRWIRSISRVSGRAGDGQNRLVGLHLDITEQRTYLAIQPVQEASEKSLALASDNGEIGLFDYNLATDEIWLSDLWLAKVGTERAGADAHKSTNLIERIHPDDRGIVNTHLQEHLSGASAKFEIEYRCQRADGTYRWVAARGRVTSRAPDGKPLRLVGTMIDVSDRREAESRVAHMAHHDLLTNLPNRNLFRHNLDLAIDRAWVAPDRMAVLVCGLDHFRAINDTLGHAIGDQILCATAERICSVVGEQSRAARLGGDEFAIVLADVDGEVGAQDICQQIVSAIEVPFVIDGVSIDISISIGVVMIADKDATADEILKRAEIALFDAKSAGRSTYRLFDTASHARTKARSLLALDMKDALRREDFFLVYQPIVDVATGRATSFEALLRWQHPIRGLISPSEFIPVAEQTGLIRSLGAWALAEACRVATSWPAHIHVSVNVSAVQFQHDLETIVFDVLSTTGLPAGRLKLEVTESVLLENAEQALRILHRLRGHGVHIALDDFGTGYSSLGYLRRFPFDAIKIDRAFIRDIADPDAAAIVRAVVGIGDRLGMVIIAEGVESQEQLEIVQREGCSEVQGFLFSKPLTAGEAKIYLGLGSGRAVF